MANPNSASYAGQKLGACQCTNLEIRARGLAVYNDTPLRRLILRAVCLDCGNEAQFLAIPHDQAPEFPSTTPDGREAHLPILMMPAVEEANR